MSVKNSVNKLQRRAELPIKKTMKEKNMTRSFVMAAVFLIAPLFLTNQAVFAGDPGCQSGYSSQNRENGGYGFASPASENRQNRQFAAAQINNEQDQPPGSENPVGSETAARMMFSFLSPLFLILGGIWLLFVLLRQRFNKFTAAPSASRSSRGIFIFKPSFALSIFGFLLIGIIVGSVLTSASEVSASCETLRQTGENRESVQAAAVNQQPVFRSAQQIGGSGYTQIGAPVFDSAGNRYVRGGFIGTLTIGSTTLTATADMDMFVAKYDANGNALWARQGSGSVNAPSPEIAVEGATAMGIYADNQIYVAGSFVKTLTLQGGNNPNLTLNDNGGSGYNYEPFIAKYDGGGNLLWAKGGNSGSPQNPNNLETGENAISRIVFDYNGDPFVSGSISGSNFLGAAITNFICFGQQNCALHGKTDIIVAKLDQTNGAPTQMKILGGADDDNALDLAIFNDPAHQLSKLYLVGNFSSTQIALPTSFGNEDVFNNTDNSIGTFVTGLQSNSSGTSISSDWGKVLDNDGIIGVNQIATNPSNGDAFITGYFTGTISLPVTLGGGTITDTRSGTGDAAVSGFVASLNSSNGDFFRITKLGGEGHAIAFGQSGDFFVVGALYDSAEFGNGQQTLDSFGASDVYVANFDKNTFGFNWAKAVAARGTDGVVAIGNPSSGDGSTKNRYSPLGITFYAGRMYISGDFTGTLSLDCLTLTTNGVNVHSYIAELGLLDDPTSCRILTNPSTGSSNWNNPENWNGGIIPAANDSVYLPYRKFPINQIYNPQTNVPLTNLSIGGNQTLTLQQNLTVNGRLDLLGGMIDAGSNAVTVGANGQVLTVSSGRVNGQFVKQFSAATGSFTFPVGTNNGYSPVTLSNITGSGTFSVTANEGAYPNTATGLSTDRANRWWNLTNGGLTKADLTFKYVSGDITTGTESRYRIFRIPAGGGAAAQIPSTIDTVSKTATALNVTDFSDWTLAQPAAPTAANLAIKGRVTKDRRAISGARVSMTDSGGRMREVMTNIFGYYQFENVQAGAVYVFQVRAKRFTFAPSVVSVNGQISNLDFTQ